MKIFKEDENTFLVRVELPDEKDTLMECTRQLIMNNVPNGSLGKSEKIVGIAGNMLYLSDELKFGKDAYYELLNKIKSNNIDLYNQIKDLY